MTHKTLHCEVCSKKFTTYEKVKRSCCSTICGSRKPRKPLLERFLEKVDKTDSCWLWTGTLSIYGYGKLWNGKRKELASRIAWILFRGEIPKGMCVLHNCPGGDNRSCVNPDHLFLGTKADNNKDRAKKGRNKNQNGEKNTQAVLTTDKVLTIRSRYKTEKITQKQLALEFGVSLGTISDVLTRKNWKHI